MLVISPVTSAKVCMLALVTDMSFSVGVISTAASSEYTDSESITC
jgi:hypothetical protein